MDKIQETMKEAQYLIEQIKHCKMQIQQWKEASEEDLISAVSPSGTPIARTHPVQKGNPPPRPEIASAIVFAKQLIITALNQELTRLEAELSTYTITKQ